MEIFQCWMPGPVVAAYRTYPGLDHVGLVAAPGTGLTADLLRWTADRFAAGR